MGSDLADFSHLGSQGFDDSVREGDEALAIHYPVPRVLEEYEKVLSCSGSRRTIMDYETIGDESGPLLNFDANSVMDLLLELKIEYRKVVSLYYLESYSYKKITKILDVPIGTVISRLARGKESLRRKLRTEGDSGKFVSDPRMERMSNDG